jgi:ribosomal protein S18 acetylase RimI-like enzyme
METIRIAGEKDYQAVLELETIISKQNSEGCPDVFKFSKNPIPIELYNKEISDGNIYVFEIDKKIIGFYWARVIEMENERIKHQKIYFIYSLIIKEEYMRRGYGKKIFQYIEEDAKTKGCQAVGLDVWEYNKHAKIFYEKMGMEVKYSSMRKTLTVPGSKIKAVSGAF